MHRVARALASFAVLTTLVGGLAASSVIPAIPATADSVTDRKKSLDDQIAELKDVLEGASQDLVDAAVALKTAQVELVDARAALVSATANLASARRKDAELASQLAFAQAQEDKGVRDLDARESAEQATRTTLGRIARDAYLSSGLSTLSVALQADSPEQFADRMAAATAALRSRNGAVNRLTVEQADLRANTAKLAAIREQVSALKQASAVAVQQLAEAEAAAQAAETRIAQLVATEQRAVATIQTKIAAEKARMDALQSEQAKLQAILLARARELARQHARLRQGQGQGLGGVIGPSHGFLSYAANGPITSPFGMRYHPILHIWRMHTGIDFGITCGTPVYAAADGSVISAGWAGGYGNRIVIDHGWVAGGDLATTYNHLTTIVAGGGAVRRGQLIAYSGTTGLSTGCHLHFETLFNGVYVDPMRFL